MSLASFRGVFAALAITAACGSAQAATFSAKGNYDVTFSVSGGGSIQYCVTLATQGAADPYRDTGSVVFYRSGSVVGSGTYVVFKKTIDVAIVTPTGSEYLTAAGAFAAGQAFNTAAIDFNNGATILGTATFQFVRNGGSCAKSTS